MPHQFSVYFKNKGVYVDYIQDITSIYTFVDTVEDIRAHYNTPEDDTETALYYLKKGTLEIVKVDPLKTPLYNIAKHMVSKNKIYWGKFETLVYDSTAHPEDGINEAILPGLPTEEDMRPAFTPLSEPYPQPNKCACCSHISATESNASVVVADAANF
ncbi:hypothetical protein LPJ66_009334 [Kickxella alabastrina]|uniref:Uncharacterized protein n=1 Tax=Kickxella alabastrina TaxID=61397 RepID=A0ACC1I764_9FUNG|nr:hypothetical protein LPJ66_009334 [Kickxella alabastrina]